MSCVRAKYLVQRMSQMQVLITLHVSAACAACPYVGKSHGFEYACPLPGAPGALACVEPPTAEASPTALLLALEPYTVDVSAARAARVEAMGMNTRRGINRLRDGSASSHGGTPCSAHRLGNEGEEQASCRSMNLWEYLLWLREHQLTLTLSEIQTLGLQLVSALHSLHNDANVRTPLTCIVRACCCCRSSILCVRVWVPLSTVTHSLCGCTGHAPGRQAAERPA